MTINPHKHGVFFMVHRQTEMRHMGRRIVPSGAILFTFMNFIEK